MSRLQTNTSSLQAILEAVNNLPEAGGTELPALSNPASTSEVLLNKEFINQNGIQKVGIMPNNGIISSSMDGINIKSVTIPQGYTGGGTVKLDDTIDNEVSGQANLIAQIYTTLANKSNLSLTIDDTSAAYVNGEQLIL